MLPVVRDRAGRGRSIYDNVVGGEMWMINDENPEAERETYVTLIKSSKGSWFVWDADEGFKSQDLQNLVDEYNRQKNLLELEELVEQANIEEAFRA